nr:MAG TPA: hypothetical protein [Caudoviricetes sp.]
MYPFILIKDIHYCLESMKFFIFFLTKRRMRIIL